MESTEAEQPVAWVDGGNNPCMAKESQVESNSTSIEPPNFENKQTEEPPPPPQTEEEDTSKKPDNVIALEWITDEQVDESLNDKNDDKPNLLENDSAAFVEALCEAEVEKNLTELEDKVKNMLEELEKTSDDATEKLVVEMDLNDINNLRDELDDLVDTNEAGSTEAEPQADVDEELKDNRESTGEVSGESGNGEDVENTESTLNELEKNDDKINAEEDKDTVNEQDGMEGMEVTDNHDEDTVSAATPEPEKSEPQNEQIQEEAKEIAKDVAKPVEKEVNSNISILENTLINGKETEKSLSKLNHGEQQSSSDTTTISNEIQPPAAPDLIVRYVNPDGVKLELAECPASGSDNDIMEFCLQQDSLCNLISASIESSLTVDTAPKDKQEVSLLQHLLLSEPSITSFKTIEDVFQDLKSITSTQYLLLYSKLHLRCTDINPASLTTAFDVKRRSVVSENTQLSRKIQNITKRILSQTLIEEVDKIFKKMDTVSSNELLFLHMGLPKGFTSIKDTLRITTICCRPIVSQTIMWLKTHYEEYSGVLTCKPDVYKGYQNFCEKNQIKPCGIPDFGKIIKRIFPEIYHRRQVVRGKTQYFYCGLRRRYQLASPKLPKLSSKAEVKEVPYNCCGCCAVYVYMHNLKYRQLSMKDYLTPPSHETASKKRPPKDPNFYKKGDFVNGKSILVHDPLELLSLSMNDNSQTGANDQSHVNRQKEKVAPRKECNNATVPVVREYKNTKPKSRSKGRILKVKFKQYRHSSIKNIMNKFEDIIVPYDLYNVNVNPIVALDNKQLHNWCAANIERFIDQISNINILKNSDSSKLKVKYECCNKTLKVNQYYGEQLRDLKRELENLEITKYYGTDDYRITYVYPAEQLPDLLQLAERFSKTSFKKNIRGQTTKPVSTIANRINKSKISSIFSAIKNKHVTIEKLLEKVDNITLPEEILTRNIDPQVSLNSSEVTDWYQNRLNALKHQMTNPCVNQEDDVTENEEEFNDLCETELVVSDDTITTPEDSVATTSTNLNLNSNRKRPLNAVDEDESPIQKKQFHLSDIINCSENAATENTESKTAEFACYFCLKDFQNEKELQNHCDIHLRCRTCKRRMPNQNAMIDHLVKHCFMNNAKCAPNLILPRIDQVSLVLNRYPAAFDPSYKPPINLQITNQNQLARYKAVSLGRLPPSVLNFNNINRTIDQILPSSSTNANATNNNNINNVRKGKAVHTYSKSQKSTNFLRLSKGNPAEVAHYQITTNPFKNMNEVQNLQQSTSHLKSTISNNFNRIFLLSNNPSAPQPDSSNVIYGLYLNNRTERSSPICLNSYNRVGSDCALNTNPSCSLSESTNFMQIVETPNTSLPQPPYDSTVMPDNNITSFEHQDHSYFQQPVYQLNNDVPSMSNGLINGVPQPNMHQNSMYDMSFLNNINSETQPCGNSLASDANKVESTNASSAMPGQFRIRVKDIRELS